MPLTLTDDQKGVSFAIMAYLTWGLSPLYWKHLTHLPFAEVFAHRVIWSALFCFFLLILNHKFSLLKELKQKKFLPLLATTILITVNWATYLYAINTERLLEASLGYFINPVLNIFLGFLLLKEKLGRLQWVAVILALMAVMNEVITFGALPWISLSLAISFGLYGLIRKISPLDSLVSLTMECFILTLPLLMLVGTQFVKNENAFLGSWPSSLLLIGGGLLTALPLLFFGPATKLINYSTIGMIQYLAPTLHFTLAVFLYNEPFSKGKFLTFIPIWLACFLYSYEGVKKRKITS